MQMSGMKILMIAILINIVGKAQGGVSTLGHSYDYNRYKSSSGGTKTFHLRGLVQEATATLNYIARNAEGLAFKFLYDNNRYSGIYGDRIENIRTQI